MIRHGICRLKMLPAFVSFVGALARKDEMVLCEGLDLRNGAPADACCCNV